MTILAVDDEELALEGMIAAIHEAAPSAEVHGFSYVEDVLDFAQKHPCDAVFLDVELGEGNGIELAIQLQILHPDINVIFTTGYDDYMRAAFDMHASGYLKKPITARKIQIELNHLRHPVEQPNRLQIRTFGNFEAYADGRPLVFRSQKTRELFAYLIDRNSALCSNSEIISVIFDDDNKHDGYLRQLRKDLIDTLTAVGCSEVLNYQRGRLGILPSKLDCDYYDWLSGKRAGCTYRGEYMSQYSWAEYTNAMLARTL